MKIQLLSDLHLEANPDFVPRYAPGADVLVLAGDIGSYQQLDPSHSPHGLPAMPEPDWGLRRFADWPVPVMFVPGNHEYDALDFDETHQRLRETCDALGFIWLERAVHTMGRVRFVGTTLWSDFDALAHVAPPAPPRKGKGAAPARDTPEKLRQKAYRAANFYLGKMQTQRGGTLFDAEAMRAQSLVCQQWLQQALEEPWEGETVVVTHFAPSLRSADPRYGLVPGTAGFCNALDPWLQHADLWLHGHLHCAHDYTVGRCRVRANPLGYADKNEQLDYDPLCCVELTPKPFC